MRSIKLFFLAALFALSIDNAFAHALWIETSATGKAGQKQTVKIYYGEFAENERDNVDKWYSDVKEFSLWLVGPDQQKTKLSLTQGSNYFESTFTPGQDGVYVLQVSHEAKELGGTTKYHFLATANVRVGKSTLAVVSTNVLNLYHDDVSTGKANSLFKLKANLNGAAAKDKTVSVFSPSGWSKQIKTNESGVAEFTPLWPGRYVVEVSDMDKTPGDHHGKNYTATWKGATYSFEVK